MNDAVILIQAGRAKLSMKLADEIGREKILRLLPAPLYTLPGIGNTRKQLAPAAAFNAFFRRQASTTALVAA
jgi:hypothetical protein